MRSASAASFMRKPTTINTVRALERNLLSQSCLIESTLTSSSHHFQSSFLFSANTGSTTRDADAEYKLAQSGDATCNGLESAEVSLRKCMDKVFTLQPTNESEEMTIYNFPTTPKSSFLLFMTAECAFYILTHENYFLSLSYRSDLESWHWEKLLLWYAVTSHHGSKTSSTGTLCRALRLISFIRSELIDWWRCLIEVFWSFHHGCNNSPRCETKQQQPASRTTQQRIEKIQFSFPPLSLSTVMDRCTLPNRTVT